MLTNNKPLENYFVRLVLKVLINSRIFQSEPKINITKFRKYLEYPIKTFIL